RVFSRDYPLSELRLQLFIGNKGIEQSCLTTVCFTANDDQSIGIPHHDFQDVNLGARVSKGFQLERLNLVIRITVYEPAILDRIQETNNCVVPGISMRIGVETHGMRDTILSIHHSTIACFTSTPRLAL